MPIGDAAASTVSVGWVPSWAIRTRQGRGAMALHSHLAGTSSSRQGLARSFPLEAGLDSTRTYAPMYFHALPSCGTCLLSALPSLWMDWFLPPRRIGGGSAHLPFLNGTAHHDHVASQPKQRGGRCKTSCVCPGLILVTFRLGSSRTSVHPW